ncbi:NADH-quinone oxidoreductase subunit L [Buchnera aphidicola (Cinara kochiana kochiana)]|uniref:NADH-quinone oxidoreductase subunit L n=1 Tax=Buchnera aphidicola (Cinara kochiana kochiana) TaxID=2518976 RepID=A0A451D5E5_9GAMM|nr:NADH-quinone oxidoreductase subunit L [Buchnera aphidicola]VFP81032.1 NADH-quinone oxidoreductase subunit L [Buchnera aphidicola (Cinara kochiana kochiana)]
MNLIYYVVIFPLLSCLLLVCLQKFLSKNNVALISISSVFVSLLFLLYVIYDYYHKINISKIFFVPMLHWITVNNYNIEWNFLIDFFSLSMLAMVLLISICVYLFSFWYMRDSVVYTKYFIYMNLFILCMIIFILTSNLITMFCAWEIVGVCSYLLIGFYFNNERNGYAAIKSFLMTRFGDVFFLISIFLIFLKFNTVDFLTLQNSIDKIIFLNNSTNYLSIITFLLIIAAIGKSAQVPLHTWLIGAMVGPTPASALIHSATMVTMGVYLILRTYVLFIFNTYAMSLLAIIGCITIIISSISAIFENNIKCILAYSTMSQIGYMFLALGSNNIKGAFFHLICHAFFKSILFLSAGSIIKCVNNEQNISKMGSLYKKIPFVYITFLIGSFSLVSLPFLTSSFYSKSNILFNILYHKNNFLLIFSLIGIFLTSIYVFRMVFLVFHGSHKSNFVFVKKNFFHNISLFVLCIGCTPITWNFMSYIWNQLHYESFIILSNFVYVEYLSSILSVFGFIIVYFIYIKKNFLIKNFSLNKVFNLFDILTYNYWFFDVFYSYIFVQTYCNLSNYLNKNNFYYIERFLLDKIFFPIKRLSNLNSLNMIHHIRWYIFCLTSVLLIIFFVNYY